MIRRNLRVEGQDARRRRVLERQRASRKEALRCARAIVQSSPPEEEDQPMEMNGNSSANENARRRRKAKHAKQEAFYATQIQTPEWMLDVPCDLGPKDWMVLAKPEGQRCLVIVSNGHTISRKKNGKIMHRFQSQLPNGSFGSGAKQGFSILDCVFHQQDKTYYVLDMLCWNGFPLYDSTAEFRFFWLQSKLAECTGILSVSKGSNDYRFQPVPVFECDLNGIKQAYEGAFPYQKDGLLFYNKHSHYANGLCPTPLVVAWKDAKTSRYPIDTPDGINPYPIQSCVLRSDASDPCVLRGLAGDIVAVLDIATVAKAGLKCNELARFSVIGKLSVANKLDMEEESMQQDEEDGEPRPLVVIEKLAFHEKCGYRSQPDSSCRIAFQYAMRNHPLGIESIVNGLH